MREIKASKKAPKKVKRIASVKDVIGESFIALFHDDIAIDPHNIYPLFQLKGENTKLVLDLHTGALYLSAGEEYTPVSYDELPQYLKKGGKGSGKYKHLSEKNWRELTDKKKAAAIEAYHHPAPVERVYPINVTPPDFEAYYIKISDTSDEQSVYLRNVGKDVWRVFYAKSFGTTLGWEPYTSSEYTLKDLLIGKERRAKSGKLDCADRLLGIDEIQYLSAFMPNVHETKRKNAWALATDESGEKIVTAYYWKEGKSIPCADEDYVLGLFTALKEIACCSVLLHFEEDDEQESEIQSVAQAEPEFVDAVNTQTDQAQPEEQTAASEMPTRKDTAPEPTPIETLNEVRLAEFAAVPPVEDETNTAEETVQIETDLPAKAPVEENTKAPKKGLFSKLRKQKRKHIQESAPEKEASLSPEAAVTGVTEACESAVYEEKAPLPVRTESPVPAGAEETVAEAQPQSEAAQELKEASEEIADVVQPQTVPEERQEPDETQKETEEREPKNTSENQELEPVQAPQEPEQVPESEKGEELTTAIREEAVPETQEDDISPALDPVPEAAEAESGETEPEAIETAHNESTQTKEAAEGAQASQPESESEQPTAPAQAPAMQPVKMKRRRAVLAKEEPVAEKLQARFDLPQLISAYSASGKKRARKKELMEALAYAPLIVPISVLNYTDTSLVYVSKQAYHLCKAKIIPFVLMADKQALLPDDENQALREGVMVKTVLNKGKTYIPVFADFKTAKQVFGTNELFGIFTLKNIVSHLSHNESVQGITINPMGINLKIEKNELLEK